ncbi:acyclic terpene utilization AtuA family protein [Corynebacterium crudilactis]|uniref:ABC transporter substrate-binding protein n=1 Tax=Corynebacterium crudilactis TaxID=1652495 RepID=A0A172QV34_9CORY|nr:acyclic terpene utilization AtuA family protein [Corynebacterium crudilactis]ANE04554.1 ABC transporter substrate-binding protein [Corynebacterium crudilactis]
MSKIIRLGAGAGFSGDRIDPAQELVEHADLDYLIFECLGERTVAAGELRKRSDSNAGFDPLLEARIRACLPAAIAHGTRIITNAGAANPQAAATLIAQIARDISLPRPISIAVVTGDSVLDSTLQENPTVWETKKSVADSDGSPVSAHAYIGIDALLPALESGADVIIAGRVADPSLYLAPLVHEFGWRRDDYHLLGAGTAVGHLLECAGQLTGGYYADPVTKPVPNMAQLGFPFAEVSSDGSALLKKLPHAGGILTTRTCTEQLLYEVSEPAGYITPDVVADFSNVIFTQVGPETVHIKGATGTPRTDFLKVTLGYQSGWMGEGQISYAGPRALERAQLAADIVMDRLIKLHKIPKSSLNVELIGTGSAFRGLETTATAAPEVRVRIAGIVPEESQANIIGWEVESLYTNGPAAGGGARQQTKELLSIRSALLPRELVCTTIQILEVPVS